MSNMYEDLFTEIENTQQDNSGQKNVMELLVSVFFAHQIRMKMFHFQTMGYGGHKTSDSYLLEFAENFDKFMEIAQGRFGKLQVKEIKFNVVLLDDATVKNEMDEMIKTLKSVSNKYKDYSELTNIIDEIVGNANQFKYLIDFK